MRGNFVLFSTRLILKRVYGFVTMPFPLLVGYLAFKIFLP